jgi:hypothetical protein
VQYVEGLNGETARRSRVSALAAEALMNNAGQVAFSLACICLQGAVMVFTGESGTVSPMPSHTCPWRGTPFEFHALPLPYSHIFFILPRLLAIINLS